MNTTKENGDAPDVVTYRNENLLLKEIALHEKIKQQMEEIYSINKELNSFLVQQLEFIRNIS